MSTSPIGYDTLGQFQEIFKQILSHPDSLRTVELGIDRWNSDDGGSIEYLPSAQVVGEWTQAPLLRELVLIGRIPEQNPFPQTFLRGGAPSLQHRPSNTLTFGTSACLGSFFHWAANSETSTLGRNSELPSIGP